MGILNTGFTKNVCIVIPRGCVRVCKGCVCTMGVCACVQGGVHVQGVCVQGCVCKSVCVCKGCVCAHVAEVWQQKPRLHLPWPEVDV